MIKIDKNVPIPTDKGDIYPGERKRGRASEYPFEYLKIGDSFWVPEESINSVSVRATRLSKQLSRQFTSRKEEGGLRVWRVK